MRLQPDSVCLNDGVVIQFMTGVCLHADSCLSSLPLCVFTVKPLGEAAFTSRGLNRGAALGSGLLIINVDLEKVTAGSPGVTVAMATLIKILFVLIGCSGRAGAAELVYCNRAAIGVDVVDDSWFITAV